MTEDQVSSGEFADLQPNPKVYLDSNIVSAIAKDDIPTESEALNRLLQAWDDKKVDLVTSEVTLWEISAHQNELKRRLVERTYRRLAKAQIIRWYELAGRHSYGDGHTWISTPIIQNDPAYAALLALGLEVVDAQHVFVAVKQKCNKRERRTDLAVKKAFYRLADERRETILVACSKRMAGRVCARRPHRLSRCERSPPAMSAPPPQADPPRRGRRASCVPGAVVD